MANTFLTFSVSFSQSADLLTGSPCFPYSSNSHRLSSYRLYFSSCLYVCVRLKHTPDSNPNVWLSFKLLRTGVATYLQIVGAVLWSCIP